jgi:hypothetical protein
VINTPISGRAHGARRAQRHSSRIDRRLAGLGPVEQRRKAFEIEFLEKRTMLSFPPLPIVPGPGESTILENAKKFEAKNQLNPLDNMPIPFTVVAQHAGGAPVLVKNNPLAGAPMKVEIDVDSNPATGKGGKDVAVEVSTELFLNGVFNPHLAATFDRLGGAPFASDFEVLVSFPFSAFNAEVLPGDSNLFFGYKTTGAAGPNAPGGIAPLKEVMRFVPNVQAGAAHQVEIQLATTGASNPLQFITGYFDGTNVTGILDAAAYAAWVQQPPANITLGVGVSSSAIFGGAIDGTINLGWTASAKSKVVFDYLEEESGVLSDSDFNTKVTFDQMPTSEQLTLKINEAAGTLTLKHRANSAIGKVEILSERNDGLKITGTLTDIPTEVDFTLGLAGTATLNVNANTLDGKIEVIKDGGFLDTDAFLGYDIGYASAGFTDAPDLTIGYIPALDAVGVAATNPGECIGKIELVIGDDANLELPPFQAELGFAPWDDPEPRHVFSLIDDGTHGTAAVRLVHVEQATLDLNATDISEAFTLKLCEAAPLTAYIRTTEDSNLIPDHDIEITLNINDIPEGQSSFNMVFPNDFNYDLPEDVGIDTIHAFGHIDCTFFDVLASELPNKFKLHFDPDGELSVLAEDKDGNPDRVSLIAVRLWIDDEDCTDPLLPGSALASLLGAELREARARLEDIPSFHATWSDGANTAIDFNTDAAAGPFAFLGGAQVAVSTAVDLAPLAAATLTSPHYLTFKDQGQDGVGDPLPKQLKVGAFGIDHFAYASNDAAASYSVHYDANAQHQLDVVVETEFGGRFFPTYAIDTDFNIDSVPLLWDMSLDVDPEFHYHGSSGIDSITLSGVVDDTDDDVDNGTNILATMLDMPKDVDFVLNPSSDAALTMNAPATLVALHLDSDNDIFGSGYRLLEASIANIPAHWNANWGGGQFVLEAKDAADAPAPMGAVIATISKSNDPTVNTANIHPFTVSGPGGARINRSAFAADIDTKFYSSFPGGAAATLDALNAIYNNAQNLDPAGDHAVARVNGGSLDFFNGQFTGFQKVAYQPNSNGGHFEFNAPSPGLHPFFAGVGLDDKFLYAHIDNIPDTSVLDIDLAGGDIHFHTTDDTGATAGDIDLYYGPEGSAADNQSAMRGILQDTPDDVHLTWNFGFPDGAANFVASNEFRLLFLTQDGSNRIVAGAQLKELQAGYGLDFLPLTVTSTTTLGVPTGANLVLFRAHAGIDNDASNEVGVGNAGKPGVSGFFNLYQMTTEDLTNTANGVAPGAAEYTPTVTFQMKDFTRLDFEVTVEVTLIAVLELPGELHFNHDLQGPDGQFGLQLWSSANTDETFLDILGIRNPPDYSDNTPFFIIPFGTPRFDDIDVLVFNFGGFGDFSDLFDPLA